MRTDTEIHNQPLNGMNFDFRFCSAQGKGTAVFMLQLEATAGEIASVEKLRKPHKRRLGILWSDLLFVLSIKNGESFNSGITSSLITVFKDADGFT